MTDRVQNKSEQQLCYTLERWKKKGQFDILNHISEYVTLVQLLYTVGNVSHFVGISGTWIFDSNYKKTPTLVKNH